MAIYVTGDIHGEMGRFFDEKYSSLTDKDYIIVVGDFGLLWERGTHYLNMLELIKSLEFTILWIDGNHENHDWIDSLPVTTWNGGKVHKILDNCIHLMRGQIYTIENKKFFACGGATSIDKMHRIPHISWWEREIPSYGECNEAIDNLANHDFKVDYIITHAASNEALYLINPTFNKDSVTKFLSEVEKEVEYKHWYLGHYHEDRELDDKHTLLYYNLIPIE